MNRQLERALPMRFFRSYYACDISSVCQQVWLSRADWRAHLCPSLRSRLPQEEQAALRGMAPPPAVDKGTAKLAYVRMGLFLPATRNFFKRHVFF